MPSYYDPISLNDVNIDATSTMYLVKIQNDPRHPEKNTFAIKGVSSGFDQLACDPQTHGTSFWPINTAKLLSNQSDTLRRTQLFPNDELTTKPLSLEQVKTYLGFDPNGVPPTRFNKAAPPVAPHPLAAALDEVLPTPHQPPRHAPLPLPIELRSPDEIGLVLGSGDIAIAGTHSFDPIRIIDFTTRELIRSYSQYDEGVSSILQLLNGNLVLAGATDSSTIRIIDVDSGELIDRLSQNDEGVDCMLQLDPFTLLVAGSKSHSKIRMIDLTTGDLIKTISQFGEGVNTMLPLSDGTFAVAGKERNGTVRVINATTGELVDRIEHEASIDNAWALQSYVESGSLVPMRSII